MEQEIQGMLKSLTKGVTRKYSSRYLVKGNSPILPGDVLAYVGCFPFILAHSCLFRLVVGCFIFYKKGEGT